MHHRVFALALLLGGSCFLRSCHYLKLFHPSVLEQINPDAVCLLDELPAVDLLNKDIVGKLSEHSGLSDAKKDPTASTAPTSVCPMES